MPDGFVYFTPRLRLAFFVITAFRVFWLRRGGEERPEAAQAKAPPARGPPRTDIPDRTATRRARRRAKMGFWSRPASPPFHLAGPPFHFYGPPFHLSGPSFHPLGPPFHRSTHLGPPFRPIRSAVPPNQARDPSPRCVVYTCLNNKKTNSFLKMSKFSLDHSPDFNRTNFDQPCGRRPKDRGVSECRIPPSVARSEWGFKVRLAFLVSRLVRYAWRLPLLRVFRDPFYVFFVLGFPGNWVRRPVRHNTTPLLLRTRLQRRWRRRHERVPPRAATTPSIW